MFISYFGQRKHWFRSNQYPIAILSIAVVDLMTSNCSSFNCIISVNCLVLLVLLFTADQLAFLSLTILNVFFSVSISPLLQNAYSNCFKPEEQGRAMGVLGSVDNLAGMCGPLVGGILFDAGGLYYVYLFCLTVTLFCIGTSSFSFLLYRLGFKQSAS
jgi:predicted MFS family arabinose efflux permease